MKPFAVVVAPGRYDAAEQAVAAAFHRETRRKPSLLFSTEQSLAARSSALAIPGYGLARIGVSGRKAEQVVLFNEDDWADVHTAREVELEDGTGGHNSQKFPLFATVVVLRANDGRLLACIAVHMPSHLDKASPFYFPVNLILWRKALKSLAAEVQRLERRHPGIAVMIGGDWNARQSVGTWTGAALHKSLAGFRHGKGDLFNNLWCKGVHTIGTPTTVAPQGSSDHPIKRYLVAWDR
jgi:hypothetical protein